MWQFVIEAVKDVQPGRIIEYVIFVAVLFARFNPHLVRIEKSLKEFVSAAQKSFAAGDQRMTDIEARLEAIDGKKPTPQKYQPEANA